MLGIVYLIVLIALIRLLLMTERPLMCAVLLSLVSAFFGWLLGAGPVFLLIAFAVNLAFGFGYFWLLNRFQATMLFWVILIVGILARPAAAIFLA